MSVTQNKLAAAFAVSVSAATFGYPLHAEGVELSYGIGLRLQSESNADLAPISAGATNSAALTLSFGLVSETAQSRLAISARGNIEAATGPNTPSTGLVDPSVEISYDRGLANADLSLSASHSTTDVANGDVTNFDTGTGTQQTNRLSAALNWGKTDPLGFGLSASLSDTSYQDASPTLFDRRTAQLGANLRADLSQVLQFTLAASLDRFDPDTGATRTTRSLDAGLNLARPRGTLSLTLGLDDTPNGQRQRFTFGNQLELANAAVTYSLGSTRGASGKSYLTGALNYKHDLPKGAFNLDLARAVSSSDTTDAETLQTSAGLNWTQDMTPTASLVLGLSWAEQTDTATDLSTTNTQLSATWRQAFGQDWAMDLGYTHRLRNSDSLGKGDSDLFFLSLRRDFSVRY